MREYSKVSPQFWYGKTGKALKSHGQEAMLVALYLMTCQHANMLGIYHLSPQYIAIDTGMPLEGALKGLRSACEAGFCSFDEASEVVWVMEMAAYQVGEQLDAKDNRCKGIQREYDALPENPYLTAFYEHYAAAFCMTSCRGKPKPLRSPSKVPPKPRAGTGAGAGERRGARLQPQWEPTADGWAFAVEQGLSNGKAVAELDRFRDYWIAKAGAAAAKTDWDATWRNWVRKAGEFQGKPGATVADKFAGAL